MKQEVEFEPCEISTISLHKLLSFSNLFKDGIIYGKHCCLIDVNTDTSQNIFKNPIRIDAYMFVVCTEGLVAINYNLYNQTLSANNMFLYNKGSILSMNAIEPCHLKIMVFNHEFFDELSIKLDNIPLQYKILREQQIFPISAFDCCQLQTTMSQTAICIGMNQKNSHYCEMVKSSFKAFIYRALYIIYEQYGKRHNEYIPTQENSHFERFMSLLEENYKKEHSIHFYSNKMNLSPKYLSLMIKKVSGKLATEWIDEYIIIEAKNLLKYSSMSIQEISYSLNFRTQSFFGKFFKRHTGLSPNAYRVSNKY